MNGPMTKHRGLTVHWHFIYLGGVILLNVSENPYIVRLGKINSHTFATISSGATNPEVTQRTQCNVRYQENNSTEPVNVQLTIVGEIIVDHQRHLLDVDPSSPHISCDEHTTRAERSGVMGIDPAGKTIRTSLQLDIPVSCPELLHDGLPLLLRHVPVHAGHGEVGLTHLLSEPLCL